MNFHNKSAILLMTAGILLTPALQADVKVSNLDQPVDSSLNVALGEMRGVRFTTDNSAASFTLASATLNLGPGISSTGGFFVQIWNNASNLPGTSLETLSGTADPSSLGNYTYTSSGTTLSPNTSYWLVVGDSGTGQYLWYENASNASTGSWTIPSSERVAVSLNGGSLWTVTDIGTPRFSISAVPEPGHYAVFAAAVSLGFAVWRRKRKTASER